MNLPIRSSRLNTGLLTAALLAAWAGLPALAEPPEQAEEKQLEGSFDQPLAAEDESSGVRSRTVIQTSDGNDSYKVEISGNKVKAWHNDKALSKDRIRKTRDKVELLGDDGQVMHTFRLNPTGGGAGEIPGGGRFFFREGGPEIVQPPVPPEAPDADIIIQNAPPVMLGITMSEPDEGVLDEVNRELEGDDIQTGIVVDRVIEGLPAHKSGLRAGDVIIAVGKQRGVGQEELRDILRDKEPGDELTLKVFREGKAREVVIKLDKFDASRLNPGSGGAQVGIEGMPGLLFGWEGGAQFEDARKAMEKALKELQENENLQPEKMRSEAQRALEKALKAFREAEKSGKLQLERFMGPGQDGKTWMWGGRPDQFYAIPPQTPRADGDTSRKLDRLADQLERLNRRLDELERRLDEDRR